MSVLNNLQSLLILLLSNVEKHSQTQDCWMAVVTHSLKQLNSFLELMRFHQHHNDIDLHDFLLFCC